MTWLTVAYLLLIPEVPCPDCGNLPNVEVEFQLSAADTCEFNRQVFAAKHLRFVHNERTRPDTTIHYYTYPAPLGRPRYTTVPFESLDALEEYIADRHITGGIVLEVKRSRWYRIESTPRIEFIPLKAGQ